VITNTSIASIAMIDAHHGWAAGRQGVILRYDDGVWTYSRRPADLRRGSGVTPEDIGKIIVAQHGEQRDVWVVGSPDTVLRLGDSVGPGTATPTSRATPGGERATETPEPGLDRRRVYLPRLIR